jgi:hypothetical protein
MTLFRRRVATAAIACTVTLAAAASAQRADSYTWKLGIDVGAMAFQTVGNLETTVIPSVGAQFLIMASRGGLMVGIDEGVGTNERATDNVVFNDLRRYQAVLMAFPVSGKVEPYFGGGVGIMQVVYPRVDRNVVVDPAQQATVLADARSRSSTGFLTLVGGVQGRWKRVTVFAQYQASTSPSDDKLLHGSVQTLVGGLRIGLGSAREGVAAGGY